MIAKLKKYKNGYRLTDSSNEKDMLDIYMRYRKFRVVICNEATAKTFRQNATSCQVTINNTLPKGVFFINGVY